MPNQALLSDYTESHSVSLRNRIVKENLGLVYRHTNHYYAGILTPLDDIIQIGTIGLIQAVERFKPSLGYKLSTFAIPYIRGAIGHWLRDKDKLVTIPRMYQAIQREIQGFNETYLKEQGHYPSDEVTAQTLDIPIDKIQAAKRAVYLRKVASLDIPVSGGANDNDLTLGGILYDKTLETKRLNQDTRILLDHYLDRLPTRMGLILREVFFGDLSKAEVGRKHHIREITVGRDYTKGLIKLRVLMMDDGITGLNYA